MFDIGLKMLASSGVFGAAKIIVIGLAVIAGLAYLTLTRNDAIKAAAFKVENRQLQRVIKVNQELNQTSKELALQASKDKDEIQKQINEYRARLLEKEQLLAALPKQDENKQCSLDCTLPDLP